MDSGPSLALPCPLQRALVPGDKMDRDASASSPPQHHESRAPDQVADQVTDGGVALESGGLTEGSSYLVDGGVVDSLASKNILTTDELDVAAEREEPGLSVHQALRHELRQPEGQSQTAHLYGGETG